jgi:hypothetical protein
LNLKKVIIFIIKRILIKAKLFTLKLIKEKILIIYLLKDKLYNIIKYNLFIN